VVTDLVTKWLQIILKARMSYFRMFSKNLPIKFIPIFMVKFSKKNAKKLKNVLVAYFLRKKREKNG